MRRLACALAALGLLSVLFLVLWGEPVFTSRWICSLCGMQRRMKEWQIPVTRITLRSASWEEATPMSRVIEDRGLAHVHGWVLAGGSGNGIG